jgi:periplasmic divalent cation tolerance protein
MTSQHVEVHVTAASPEEAEGIVAAAVEGRVAACAQISGPIKSTYWWKGNVERAEEWLVALKTTLDNLDELTAVVRANHSYEVPEIVAVPIVGGLGEYLSWITAETQGLSTNG